MKPYASKRRPPADLAAPGFPEVVDALDLVRRYLLTELQFTERWAGRRRFVRRASRRLDRLTVLLQTIRGGAA